MDVKIKFLNTFKDGNIFPEMVKMYQIMTVSETKLKQIISSGGEIEIMEKIIPPHKKADDKR